MTQSTEVEMIVDVGGACLHARITGSCDRFPAIVLEAGGGGTSDWWAWVEPRLAAKAKVVSYDRAGLGKSGVVPRQVDAASAAARLHALLGAMSIDPPYILVGHSLGGLLVKYFAAAFPSDIAGAVLVDPTNSDPRALSWWSGAVLRGFVGMQRFAGAGARLIGETPPLPFSRLVAGLPPHARSSALAAMNEPHHLRTFAKELKAIGAIQRQLIARPFPRRVPLLVVSAGRKRGWQTQSSEAGTALHRSIWSHHIEAARESDFGDYRTIPDADHGTILTDERCADQLARHILDFTAKCAAMRPRTQN